MPALYFAVWHNSTGTALQPILQPTAIDVSTWDLDELFAQYPEGARSKNAFFPPELCPFPFIKPGWRYMFKKSDIRYPDQFWGEVVAYHVGTLLGVAVPPAFAAVNTQTGQCAALIEWFYADGTASLVAGGNYMQRFDPTYDRKYGEKHNFRWARLIGRLLKTLGVQNHERFWAEAFLFDALIGNTDRHQENWGYLFIKSEAKENIVVFAPLFDNGTSLGYERFPDRLATWTDKDFERYLSKGTHHMKWELKGDSPRCQHFEMVSRIGTTFPYLKSDLFEMINKLSLDAIATNLDSLKKLDLPIPLSNERADLYLKLLSLRKRKLELALS